MQLDFLSKRTKLYLFQNSDFDAYYKLHSDPYLMQYIAPPLSLAKAKKSFLACLKFNQERPFKRLSWSIKNIHSGNILGIAGLILNAKAKSSASIGTILFQNCHFKGYATEVLARIEYFAHNELNITSLEGYSKLENQISVRLMCKLGYSYIKNDVEKIDLPKGYYWSKNIDL